MILLLLLVAQTTHLNLLLLVSPPPPRLVLPVPTAAARGAQMQSAKTGETAITASVCLDGRGRADVSTGVKFLDHMISSLAKHSMIDITVEARSLDGIKHHPSRGCRNYAWRCN